MVDPNHTRLSIVRQCRLVSIARSSFYYEGQGESPVNLRLMRVIDEQFLETPPGAAGGGRLSARRKRETVLRLLRGEDLESVSRELGITAARASQWRDRFLAAGQASLKSRAPDARDEANRRLQAKIGELLMETELLYAKVDQLEAGGPLARRKSRR